MKIIISGGGTGGHIYPAIAIADAVKAKWPHAEIRFVGAIGRMEMEKVPKAGYKIQGLWISGLQRKSSLKNLLLPIKVIHSLWRCFGIIRKFKPDLAIGVGGYASGPLLYAASRMGIPTMIQEQNSFPGITNKLLAKRADKICVAFDQMERFFEKDKLVLTGNPVRNWFSGDTLRLDAIHHFALDGSKKTILIVGGSLGSLAINKAMVHHAKIWAALEDVQIIWQVGALYMDRFSDSKTAKLAHVHPLKFIDRMDLAYGVADIVICRAGALTLSEIALCAKPAILIPSPNVSEDHQTKNARALVDSDAALMIRDEELEERLASEALKLIHDDVQCKLLSDKISKWAKPNATEDILNTIQNLVG